MVKKRRCRVGGEGGVLCHTAKALGDAIRAAKSLVSLYSNHFTAHFIICTLYSIFGALTRLNIAGFDTMVWKYLTKPATSASFANARDTATAFPKKITPPFLFSI